MNRLRLTSKGELQLMFLPKPAPLEPREQLAAVELLPLEPPELEPAAAELLLLAGDNT